MSSIARGIMTTLLVVVAVQLLVSSLELASGEVTFEVVTSKQMSSQIESTSEKVTSEEVTSDDDRKERLGASLNSTTRDIESLPVLHCNMFCNGSTPTKIEPWKCDTRIPACRECRCDIDCGKYGDCCPTENGEVAQKNPSEFQCIGSDSTAYVTGYYMSTSCPKSELRLPVSAHEIAPVTSRTTNITYLNERIAKCHNDENVVFWDTAQDCRNPTNDNNYDNSSNNNNNANQTDCPLVLAVPDNAVVRECASPWSGPNVIDTCNVTGLWGGIDPEPEVADRCFSWQYYPVSAHISVYKNIYCFMCNGLIAVDCMPMRSINFNMNVLVQIFADPSDRDCTENEWFDPVKKVCRILFCRSGYRLDGIGCVLINTSVTDVHYSISCLLWADVDRRSDPVLQNWTFVREMTLAHIKESLVLSNVTFHFFDIDVFEPMSVNDSTSAMGSPTIGMHLAFRVRSSYAYNRTTLEGKMLEVIIPSWLMTYNGVEFNFTVSAYDYVLYHRFNEEKFSLSPFGEWNRRVGDYSYTSLPPAYTTCALLHLQDDEIIINANKSVYLTYANTTTDLRVRSICVDTLKALYEENYHTGDAIRFAAEVLSQTLSALSLICLLLTFITFAAFPSLLSLPTKNIMCLVAFLFLAQLLLQFVDLAWSHATLCLVLGVSLHYTWLCVIFWMNVCSYHMFSVFVLDPGRPIDSADAWKPLVRYALYANGLPLLIVSTTIGVSLATTSGSSIGYGHSRCYLSTALLTGVYFVLPFGIILILNTIFFSITIWSMSKVRQVSVAAGRDRNLVHIYIKLSTLTGVFWILSIVAENVQVQVLVFMSILLNASQGIFIFMSYTANRRVYQLWKARFSPMTNAQSRSSIETKSTNV